MLMNESEEKKQLYLVNLTKYRISLIVLLCFSLLSFSFLGGLFLGVQSSKFGGESIDPQVINSLEPWKDEDSRTVMLTETRDSLGQGAIGPLHRKKNLDNRLSGTPTSPPLSSEQISSSDLLKQDRVKRNVLNLNPQRPSRKIPRQWAPPKKKTGKSQAISKSNHPKYYIQVLASNSKKKADYLTQNLQKRKYKSYLHLIKRVDNSPIYLVRIGLYKNKSRAQRDLLALRGQRQFKDAYMGMIMPQRFKKRS